MAKEEEKKEAAPAPAADSSSGGGGKIGVILTVVNLLLTIGIGAVVFVQFKKDKNTEKVADIQVAEEGGHGEAAGGHGEAAGGHGEAKADEHGGGHGGEHGAPAKPKASVVSLDQFTVNLSTAVGAPPKFARVVIAVEVPSDETSKELTTKMPQVRNSIIDLFNSKRPADLQTGEGRNFLKEEIRNALNSFLVTGKVKAIFFSNFSVSG
jgi:flagellar basal body-associated protein FliL